MYHEARCDLVVIIVLLLWLSAYCFGRCFADGTCNVAAADDIALLDLWS